MPIGEEPPAGRGLQGAPRDRSKFLTFTLNSLFFSLGFVLLLLLRERYIGFIYFIHFNQGNGD